MGYWWAIAARRKPWLKVFAKANITCVLVSAGKYEKKCPNVSRQPRERSRVHHISVISSISYEARVSYLRCVALTLALGNSYLLLARCDVKCWKESGPRIYRRVKSSVGNIFLRITPYFRQYSDPSCPWQKEKKCSSTPSFSNSAHYARLDVNVHIWSLMAANLHSRRLCGGFSSFSWLKN